MVTLTAYGCSYKDVNPKYFSFKDLGDKIVIYEDGYHQYTICEVEESSLLNSLVLYKVVKKPDSSFKIKIIKISKSREELIDLLPKEVEKAKVELKRNVSEDGTIYVLEGQNQIYLDEDYTKSSILLVINQITLME